MDVLRFGAGEQAFVILPGLSIRSVLELRSMIVRQYAAAAEKYTVYLFDRRKEMPSTYTLADMAEDTAAAMLACGLSNVFLFGASQGGMMAQCIAAKHPTLVRKLVLGSTAAHATELSEAVLRKWIAVAEEKDGPALYKATASLVYPKEVYTRNEAALAKAGKRVTEEDFARFITSTKAMLGFDVRDALAQIGCPVFIIGAKDDAVLGAEASYEMAEQFRDRADCAFYMYDGYAHAAFDFAPDYLTRMLNFFAN